jgi:origin recognition complex subunit 1
MYNLGLTRITFAGYNHEQLMKIIQSRLEGVPGGIVESDAVQFASRKVAAVSGDARRALDICRRAVELAEIESLSKRSPLPGTPSKKSRKDAAIAAQRSPTSTGRVTIATIKQAINEATASPLQQYLRGLPLSSKLLLAALLAKIRRNGLQESVLGEIVDEAKRIAKMAIDTDSLQFLVTDTSVPVTNIKAQKGWNQGKKVSRVLALGAAATELMESGVIGLEARRGDRMGKIRLYIGEEDVKQALKDDPEARGLGF